MKYIGWQGNMAAPRFGGSNRYKRIDMDEKDGQMDVPEKTRGLTGYMCVCFYKYNIYIYCNYIHIYLYVQTDDAADTSSITRQI